MAGMGAGQQPDISMADLGRIFPQLQPGTYSITSPASVYYNCIAWAASETDRRWWPMDAPDAYWPTAERDATVDCFIRAFTLLGYEPCDDCALELGYEKVALYATGGNEPTHMARQLPNGNWTSKLGKLEDIEHGTLSAVEGNDYGSVVRILRRPVGSSR